MAIAFRDTASATSNSATATAFSITCPGTVQPSDGLLLFFGLGGAGDAAPTVPAGWVLAGGPTTAGTSTHFLYKRVAINGDASSSMTFTYAAGVTSRQGATLVAYSGTDSNDPIHLVGTPIVGSVSQTGHVTPTVTTTIDQCWVVQAITSKDGTGITSYTGGALTQRGSAFSGASTAAFTSAAFDDNTAHAISTVVGGGTITGNLAATQTVTWTVALAPRTSVQIGRPTSDVTTTGWSGTPSVSPLAGDIGEVSRDDSTLVTSPVNPSSSVFETKFNSLVDPVTHSGYQVFYVLSASGSPSSSSVQVDVVENTTVRATWTETSIPATPTLYTHTMTDPQCASIVDYTNLRLRFTATAS